ncbi:MAG: tRNA (adenosine(37)-N6)-dimethylallyltransferase MiaA, partial [Candidatus Entotheonellia bacterium]
SGLYLRALTDGLFAGPGADPSVRAFLEAEAESNGVDALHHRLAEVDPDIAQRIHPHDRVRIIRALEIYMLTGTPISQWQWQWHQPERARPFLLIGLMREREDLRARIAARTHAMLLGGLVDEVKKLQAEGYPRTLRPLRSVGYAEVVAYLAGEYDLARAQELIERHTWQLAKRQMTWFRRIAQIHWISLTGTPEEAVLQAVRKMLAHDMSLQEDPSAKEGAESPWDPCMCFPHLHSRRSHVE